MDRFHAVEEEFKKEHVLLPVTPAKLIPPRPYCLPNVTGFVRNSNLSSDSDTAACINDGEIFLNLETTCKDQENFFETTPFMERDSSSARQLSSALASGQITCSVDQSRRAEIFDLYDNVDISVLGPSTRPTTVEVSVPEQYNVHPNTESLQEGMEGGKTVRAPSRKSIIKRQRATKSIVKRYRPKIQDDSKPQKSKSKHKRISSDTVDGVQPGKKRKYVKRSLVESANSKIPVSEIGNSPSLQPITPGPLISEHTPEPLSSDNTPEHLIADYTPEPFADHIPKPVIAGHSKFHAKSCRRLLDFSMDKHPQNVDLCEGRHEYKDEERAPLIMDFSLNLQPQNVDFSQGQHENKDEERASFKWDVSLNLPPQDFEDCVDLKKLINQYYHGKEKSNINSRSKDIHNIVSNDDNEMKFSLVNGRENTDLACEAIGEIISKFYQNGSGIWKKVRVRRRRRVCFDKLKDMFSETNCMEVNKNKHWVNKKTEKTKPGAISEDISMTPLFDLSLVKKKRSSRPFVRRQIFMPILSHPSEANTECNVEVERNSVKCNNVEGCYPRPDDALQIYCPEDASAKPLIATINQEAGPPLIGEENLQKMVLYEYKNGALVQYNEKKPQNGEEDLQKMVLYQYKNGALVPYREKKARVEVDLDPDIVEVWRLLTENGERAADEIKESEKLRKLREVFRGRAEAFISTMRQFLGNRHFTPWKGSVIDSLVGTFLTQNVSDHLSSSAFMSLRARYPPKHKRKDKIDNVEQTTCIRSSVQKCTGVHEQTSDANCELSDVCETRPHTESLSTACEAAAHDLEKCDVSRETLQAEANSFLEQYYDHHGSGEVPTALVEIPPASSGLEVVKKKLKTPKRFGTKGKKVKEEPQPIDWDQLRKTYSTRSRDSTHLDSVDWEAVRQASLEDIQSTIQKRGQQEMLSKRIKELLERLVKDHGSTDLEWLRDVPPDKAKEFLLSINGLGLKSVECIRLLTLHHRAFPVDTNVARIAVRLGWVPLKAFPKEIEFHALSQYPPMDEIQKYLWPALCTLDQETLYEFHYQLITFGKVFCPKISPNCSACPKRAECRHKASKDASERLLLNGPRERTTVRNPAEFLAGTTQPLPDSNFQDSAYRPFVREPIVESPCSPGLAPNETPTGEAGHPLFDSDDEMHFINLNNTAEFSRNFLGLSGEIDYSQPLMSLSHEEALMLESKFKDLNKPKETPLRDIEDLPFDAKEAETPVRDLEDSQPLMSLSHEEALMLESKFKDLNKPKETLLRDIEDLPFDAKKAETPVRDIEDLPFDAKKDGDHRMNLHYFRSLEHLHKRVDISQALVTLSPEKASNPNPKLKNVERLRTEHQVYELPDDHPLLANLNPREVDDPSPYLFAILAMGESSNFSEQQIQTGKPQELDLRQILTFTNSDIPELQDDNMVYGTIVHPCKTALEGNFPLNGTYFQVNEVFVDFASSQSLIPVPGSLLWNLPRRILYCGASAASIIKGSTEDEVKCCFCEGFMCVRAFVHDTGAPRHLPDSFHHMPLSKGRKPDEWWG